MDEIEKLRCDNIECHYKRDVLASIYEAIKQIPACGMLAILGAAAQEIQYYRERYGDGKNNE